MFHNAFCVGVYVVCRELIEIKLQSFFQSDANKNPRGARMRFGWDSEVV